ncbi:hypothetical protein CTAYLR_002886 [Chrysophaeum taylorii]|uniref:Questin oxidase n=1 Tax=Chrysophaeum taylorii TaxID=2483200 RepID=A0AAD7XR10_9STRA|nr:hypothetical protein CTAYLR_002886 [Chrysophaeum taylorii]
MAAAIDIKALGTAQVQSLLSNFQYDIEFNGYLSNHVKHAIIALAGLGAKDERIQEYWDEYTLETPYGIKLDPVSESARAIAAGPPTLDEAGARALIGLKKDFASLCCSFDRELDAGVEATLQKWMPVLVDGIPGALTHGIIHLGWALAAGNRWMTVEGLAYLAFAHVSVHPGRFGEETVEGTTPLETLRALPDLGEFRDEVKKSTKYSETDFHPEIVASGFQWQVAKVLEEGHPFFYKRPAWLDEPLDDLLRHLYDLVALLHVVYDGNFLVLHAITSLWGLDRTLRAMKADDAFARHAYRCFWVMLLALLATSAAGLPSAAELDAVAERVDADDPPNWADVSRAAIYQQEEHNIKLVFCCLDLWRRYGKANLFAVAATKFTETPNIGPAAASSFSA